MQKSDKKQKQRQMKAAHRYELGEFAARGLVVKLKLPPSTYNCSSVLISLRLLAAAVAQLKTKKAAIATRRADRKT